MRGIAAAAGLAVAACGSGSGSSPATSAGIVLVATGWLPLHAGYGTAVVGGATCQLGASSAGVAVAALVASDQSGICDYLQKDQEKASARSIEIAVVHIDPDSLTTHIAPGSYPVATGVSTETAYAFVSVSQNDSSCTPSEVTATTGIVTVTSIAENRFQGTVDARLSGGGAVIGSFDTDLCGASFPGDVCTGEMGSSSAACAP